MLVFFPYAFSPICTDELCHLQDHADMFDEFDAAVQAHRARFSGVPVPADLERVRWLIEELRVSFFAQELGTAVSVSEKRVRQALAQAARA